MPQPLSSRREALPRLPGRLGGRLTRDGRGTRLKKPIFAITRCLLGHPLLQAGAASRRLTVIGPGSILYSDSLMHRCIGDSHLY